MQGIFFYSITPLGAGRLARPGLSVAPVPKTAKRLPLLPPARNAAAAAAASQQDAGWKVPTDTVPWTQK